jgi:hypothetical protein
MWKRPLKLLLAHQTEIAASKLSAGPLAGKNAVSRFTVSNADSRPQNEVSTRYRFIRAEDITDT